MNSCSILSIGNSVTWKNVKLTANSISDYSRLSYSLHFDNIKAGCKEHINN